MINILKECIYDVNFDKHEFEYYPHIQIQYDIGGYITNETCNELDIPNIGITEEIIDEYTYHDKKLNIYNSGNKEYLVFQQKFFKINNGLILVSKKDCIDPNKFPILKNYDNMCQKHIINYDNKYFTTSLITETYKESNIEKKIKYIKLFFTIINNEQYNKHLIKHFTEVISLLQNK
jgi:hypothetical protein